MKTHEQLINEIDQHYQAIDNLIEEAKVFFPVKVEDYSNGKSSPGDGLRL